MTVSDAGWLPGERRDNRRAAMQYGVLAERNCEGLLFGAEHRRVRCLRPHRGIIDEVALLPLRHRLRVEVVAPGELFDRSLRSLYRSSDDVSGLGAAVKYLSHRASRNVGSDCLIPRHSGTAHLVCSCLWVDVWVPQVRWTDRDSDQWLNSIIRRKRAPPKQELTSKAIDPNRDQSNEL